MTVDEIYAGLNTVFRKQFKDETLSIEASTTADDVKGWDSLAHIRLILSVEKEFGVKFRTSEVADFENVGDLVEMVQTKLA